MPGLQDIGIGLGIILTAVGLIFSIRKWQVSQKAQQPNIVAKLTHGFIRYATEISPAMLLLKVIHGGGKSVRIVSVVLTFKGKNLVFQDGIVGKTKFPFDIASGNNEEFWIPIATVQKTLLENGYKGTIKMRSRFTDAIGNRFDSKPYKLRLCPRITCPFL